MPVNTIVAEQLPPEIIVVIQKLEQKGFEAYIVGGCTRDLLLGKKPKDWDVTTNALPEEITAIFEHSFYENSFGTVGIVFDEPSDPSLEVIEVTTYRLESGYSDARRPDDVTFSKKIEKDLQRRDFTINAIAYNPTTQTLIDFYNGQKDIAEGVIRAVGEAKERFAEDALRMLRAIRLGAELGFVISHETEAAITHHAQTLQKISDERIRDEFIRILLSNTPANGLFVAQRLGLLHFIAPELEEGIGIDQNQAHAYDVWEHNLRSLQHAADKGWDLDLRLSALFHDVAKPETRRWSKEKNDWTFYGHDVVGSRVTQKVLTRLKFPKQTIEKIVTLVRWHMFFSDTEQITHSAVRRMIRNVGEENIWHLMDLRRCDRIGTGRPKENPYRFRKYTAMVEEVMRDPVTVGMLAINGNDLIQQLSLQPGPKVGYLLHALLEDVLEDPTKNTKEYLLLQAKNLISLPEEELAAIGKSGKEKKDEEEKAQTEEIRKKYGVK